MTQEDPRHRELGEYHVGSFPRIALSLRHVKKLGLFQSRYLVCQKTALASNKVNENAQALALKNTCLPKDMDSGFICEMIIRSAVNAQRLRCSL